VRLGLGLLLYLVSFLLLLHLVDRLATRVPPGNPPPDGEA